jgi:hypothetical protein
MLTKGKIRAFVTYSRKDQAAFDAVCATLSDLEVDPLSDRRLVAAGEEGFTSQIHEARLRGTTPREARAAFLTRRSAEIEASPRHPAWSREP